MNFDPILDRLEEQGVGQRGKTLFADGMQAGATGLMLRQYFGGTPVNGYMPGFIQAPFMMISRGSSYDDMKSLIERAVKAIACEGVSVYGGVQFNYVRPRIKPFVYPPSPGQQWEFNVTMDCCYVDEE